MSTAEIAIDSQRQDATFACLNNGSARRPKCRPRGCKCETQGIWMNTISEAELVDFLKNNAVRRLKIVQNEVGKYLIVVTLTWKKGDWNLISTRGKPREWTCLNRLARHIRERHDGVFPTINLILSKAVAKPETKYESGFASPI